MTEPRPTPLTAEEVFAVHVGSQRAPLVMADLSEAGYTVCGPDCGCSCLAAANPAPADPDPPCPKCGHLYSDHGPMSGPGCHCGCTALVAANPAPAGLDPDQNVWNMLDDEHLALDPHGGGRGTMSEPRTEAGRALLNAWRVSPKELWTVDQVTAYIERIEADAAPEPLDVREAAVNLLDHMRESSSERLIVRKVDVTALRAVLWPDADAQQREGAGE